MRIKFLFFSLILFVYAQAAPPLEEGKSIFATRCAACHNIHKDVTGPALAGVDERRSLEWIISFVKSSQKMVREGNPEAVEVFHKFNSIPMPDHPDLTDEHIKSILAYIKSETAGASENPPFAAPKKLKPGYLPLTMANYGFFLSYVGLVLIIIFAMLLAVQTKEYQRNRQQ